MQKRKFTSELIAPCGANCGICVAHFGYTSEGKKRKRICSGCRSRKSLCAFIKKKCLKLASNQIEYCFECSSFPCEDLRALDRRYTEAFGMSMIGNLNYIKENGIEQFLKNEQERWKCPNCGSIICVHNKVCYTCGTDLRVNMP